MNRKVSKIVKSSQVNGSLGLEYSETINRAYPYVVIHTFSNFPHLTLYGLLPSRWIQPGNGYPVPSRDRVHSLGKLIVGIGDANNLCLWPHSVVVGPTSLSLFVFVVVSEVNDEGLDSSPLPCAFPFSLTPIVLSARGHSVTSVFWTWTVLTFLVPPNGWPVYDRPVDRGCLSGDTTLRGDFSEPR